MSVQTHAGVVAPIHSSLGHDELMLDRSCAISWLIVSKPRGALDYVGITSSE